MTKIIKTISHRGREVLILSEVRPNPGGPSQPDCLAVWCVWKDTRARVNTITYSVTVDDICDGQVYSQDLLESLVVSAEYDVKRDLYALND